jgi:hypothetical protein
MELSTNLAALKQKKYWLSPVFPGKLPLKQPMKAMLLPAVTHFLNIDMAGNKGSYCQP